MRVEKPAQRVQEVLPLEVAYEPRAQSWHVALPEEGANEPAAQGVQVAELAAAKVPGLQGEQVPEEEGALPAAQDMHMAALGDPEGLAEPVGH